MSSDASDASDASAEIPSPPDFARRRLLLGGASLLALGLVLNVGRLAPQGPVELEREETPPPASSGEPRHADASVHRGEEGKMGRPVRKSGMHAMESGQFLATPTPAQPVDVWGGLTGTEVGQAHGVSGLGLVGTGRGGGGVGEGTIGLGNLGLIGKGGGSGLPRAAHARRGLLGRHGPLSLPAEPRGDTGFVSVAEDRLSTFSIDVDTASYSATRRSLQEGWLPNPDSVRIEELVNYFDYDYPAPTGDVPFSVTAEVGECPWNPEHELVHVGLQGKVIAAEELPPRNLVFLVDVSGSMAAPDRLPLVQRSLGRLVQSLRAEDRIALVAYAGAAGVVLPPTSGSDKRAIHAAIERLSAGGSTNGGEGIEAAYGQARAGFMKDGVNRVILASDGDFNVGVSSHRALVKLIERQRKSGIELSVLGYGMGHRDHTMEQLADKGNGNYAYIDGITEGHKVLVKEAGGTLVTIAKDVKIQVELDPARVQSYRLIGYDNRRLAHQDFADDSKDAGEIGAGHGVTALYEVVPRPDASPEAPWMTVQLRYKAPKGKKSSLVALPVVAVPRALAETSDDFRFSAAVASFGMLLRAQGSEAQATPAPVAIDWSATQALAREALGDDPSCLRHRFVELVGRAGSMVGDVHVSTEALECGTEPEPRVVVEPEPERLPEVEPEPELPQLSDIVSPMELDYVEPASPEPSSLGAWVLEVLRLLPPLLALPLFVMALRRPRRRE